MQSKLETIDPRYFKTYLLIHAKGTEVLRGQFMSLWADLTGERWIFGENSGRKFAEGVGKCFVAGCQYPQQKKAIATGNIRTWDLTLLCGAIKTLYNNIKDILQQEKYVTVKEMEKLKKIRNKLTTQDPSSIDLQGLESYWNSTVGILTRLGVSEKDIDVLTSPGNLDEMITLSSTIFFRSSSNSDEKAATRWRELGTSAYNTKHYETAMAFYTLGINCERISASTLGILYSNRSTALSAVGRIEEAREDAELAVTLKPYWAKGYYKLATVYEKEGEYSKAILQYRIGLYIQPYWELEFALRGVESCKKMIASMAEAEGQFKQSYQIHRQVPEEESGYTCIAEEMIYGLKLSSPVASLTETKESLEDPGLFINHLMGAWEEHLEMRERGESTCTTGAPKLESTAPSKIVELKPITFKEFEKDQADKIYNGYAIQVKAVTDVLHVNEANNIIVMDENGHFGRVFINNYPSLRTVQDEIGFGCSFTIIDPYYKEMVDGMMGIRVEDPSNILTLPELKDSSLCRFCFKSEASFDFECEGCLRVKYCSERCAQDDLNKRSHHVVCKKQLIL